MQRPNIADLSLDGGPTSGGRRGSASGADEMFGDPLGIRSRKSLSGQASGAGGPHMAGGRVPGSGVVGGPPRSSVALGGTTGTGSAPPASGSNLARMPGTRKSFSNHDAERERQLAKSSATGLGGAAASRNRASTTSSSSYDPVPRGRGALGTSAAVAPAGSMTSKDGDDDPPQGGLDLSTSGNFVSKRAAASGAAAGTTPTGSGAASAAGATKRSGDRGALTPAEQAPGSGITRDKEVVEVDLLPNVEEVLENSRGGSVYGAASTQGANNATPGASSTGRSYVQAIPPVWSGRSARYKEAEKESLFDWLAVANCCGLGGNRGDYSRDERNPLSMSRTGGGPPREAAAANNKGSPEKTKVELGGGGAAAAPKEPTTGKMNEQKQASQPPQYSQQPAQLQNPENLLGYWQEEDESDFEDQQRKKRVTDEAERRLAERQAAMNKNKKQPGAGLDASSATSADGANANRPGAGAAQEQQQMKSGDASSEQKGAGAQSELETSKEDVLAASMKNKTPFRWPAWSLSKRAGVLEVKVVDESDEEWVAAVPKQRVVDDKGRDAYLLCEYDWQGERYEEDFAPTSVRRTGEERTIAELFADEQKRGTTTRA